MVQLTLIYPTSTMTQNKSRSTHRYFSVFYVYYGLKVEVLTFNPKVMGSNPGRTLMFVSIRKMSQYGLANHQETSFPTCICGMLATAKYGLLITPFRNNSVYNGD